MEKKVKGVRKVKKILAVGIMASPREQGNSDLLLESALNGAYQCGAAIKKICLNKLNFAPCQACCLTAKDGSCLINDDFQQVYDAVLKADVVMVSSPVYFGSVSAQAKMMIDRFQCYWQAKMIFKTLVSKDRKKGGFICVQAGNRDDFFLNSAAIIKNFFATAGVEYRDELFCSGLEKAGEVTGRPELIRLAEGMGRELVSAAKKNVRKG